VSFILSLHESSGAEGIDFHGSDDSSPEQFPRKYSASSAREKCQLIHTFSFSCSCCPAHRFLFASSLARFHSGQAAFVSSYRLNFSQPSQ
jgi:hypothetical protein